MKFSTSTVSALLVLALSSSSTIAAPLQESQPLEARASLGSVGSAIGRGAGTIGTTILGAGFAATLGSLLNCLESGKGAQCIGLRKRDQVVDDTITILHALQEMNRAIPNTESGSALEARGVSAGAGTAAAEESAAVAAAKSGGSSSLGKT